MARGRLALLSLLVSGSLVPVAARFEKQIKAARKKGLTGYDLIDAIDVWYGHNSPQFNGPFIQLDELGNKDGKVTVDDWLKAGLPREHFVYFDKNGDSQLDIDEAHSWHQQRQPARTMNLSEVDDPPPGHMKSLFSWKKPLPSKDLTYTKPYPHPREFWKKHMDGYLPAVLKGAQHGWPAMNWTREELSKRFGWVDAKLEPKVEGRGNDTAYADIDELSPQHRLNISDYLRVEEGKNMYVVSIVPQAMAWEVAHPSVLLCGSRRKMMDKRSAPPYKETKHDYPHEAKFDWMTHIFEANLWIATGYTRSQFHYDKEWNVNCLLSGTKRWVFLNNFWYDKQLQWSRGKKFKPKNPLGNAWTDWVYLDPDRVDLIANHKLRDMEYYELIQEAGDCIFIPYAMLHQVQKMDEDTQVAVSWMFLPETIYEEEVCKEAPLEEDLPLAVMDTLYMYTGKGVIPQGYKDPLDYVNFLRDLMQRNGKDYLDLQTFAESVTQGDAILNSINGREKKVRRLFKRVSKYAKDPKKGLSIHELRSVPLRIWTKPACEGDDEGPLPCDHGQEYHPCDDAEFAKMTEHVRKVLSDRDAAAPASAKTEASVPAEALPTNRRSYDIGLGEARKAAAAAAAAESGAAAPGAAGERTEL